MFAIENAKTRNSLRTVFENIFAKYGRDFEEDDEIDLISLSVIKPGGHLARIKPLAFGRAFKDRKHNSEGPLDNNNNQRAITTQLEDFEEDVFETERKRLQPAVSTEVVARIRSSFNKAVASTKKSKKTSNDWFLMRTYQSFDSLLLALCQRERRIFKDSASLYRCLHPIGKCFDCTLLKLLKIE